MAASLNAQTRSGRGKGAARATRRDGRVPAVVYGHHTESQPLSVDGHELGRLLATISVDNTLIDLQVDGGEAHQVLIREVQKHPFRAQVLHVDFYQVTRGEKLKMDVPVRLVGTPVGVSVDGGVLHEDLRALHVECLPRDIPKIIEVNVEEMRIGESVYVRDVQVPNATVLNDGDLVIASVTAPTVADLPEAPEDAAGVGGETEPELVRDRAADADDVPTTDQG
jgi:large subunit ribosomal protein L25